MIKFGTDGIRGIYPVGINETTAYLLGQGLATLTNNALVVIGTDTRVSGGKLSSALADGIFSKGGNIVDIGILPTNAVSYLVREYQADYGVMVSASHNSSEYNGLKVFDNLGIKICSAQEQLLEQYINETETIYTPKRILKLSSFAQASDLYTEHIYSLLPLDLTGIVVAVDCAYGSGYRNARRLFKLTNCKLFTFCDDNNGQMINEKCGATYPQYLASLYDNYKYDLGFCLDGDADRLSVVEAGQVIDTNRVFYAIAKFLLSTGRLNKNLCVGTVLTNNGLEQSLNNLGITLLRSDVGDKNVFRLMSSSGAIFGGEESGHYIFSRFGVGSDSLINSLTMAHIIKHCGNLMDYTAELNIMPQLTVSISLDYESMQYLKNNDIIPLITQELQPMCAKVIVRPSGTESKLRFLAEDYDNTRLNETKEKFLYLLNKYQITNKNI